MSGSSGYTGSLDLGDMIAADIRSAKDFLIGGAKGVSTQLLGLPGDIEGGVASMMTMASGVDFSKDTRLPDTEAVESALGVRNPNPSGAEIAGSVASGLLDPVTALKSGAALKSIVVPTLIGKAKTAADEARNLDLMMQRADAYVGSDGVLRTEIPDRGTALEDSELKHLNNKTTIFTDVGSILDHPELFAAMPELKDVKVAKLHGSDITPNHHGAYSSADDVIYLNTKDLSDEMLHSTLMHELQHAVQSKYGMNRGGNPSQFNPVSSATWKETKRDVNTEYLDATAEFSKLGLGFATDKTLKQVETTHPEIAARMAAAQKRYRDVQAIEMKFHAEYEAIPGEVEARVTQQRLKMPQEDLDKIPFSIHYERELQDSLDTLAKRTRNINK